MGLNKMKKLMILMMVLLISIFVVNASQTDFSENPIFQGLNEWSYDLNSYTYNSFLVRSTAPDTSINYNDAEWGKCEYLFGGDEFSPVPITLTDSESNYKHRSLIITMDTQILQIDSSCQVVDTYNLSEDETIISNIGAIRGGRVDNIYYQPSFSFLSVDDTNTSYVYFLTLNDETSNLELVNKIVGETNDTYGNTDYLYGMSGGCFSSSSPICSYSNRIFGYGYDDTSRSGFYLYSNNGATWSKLVNFSQVTYASGSEEGNYQKMTHDNILYFNDMNNDGNNEFILFGKWQYDDSSDSGRIYKTAITPSKNSPYYIVNQDYYELFSAIAQNANFNGAYDFTDISPCQIGSLTSDLEVCYGVRYQQSGGGYAYYNLKTGFCDSEMNTCTDVSSVRLQSNDFEGSSFFTYDLGGSGSDYDAVTWGICGPDSPTYISVNYKGWKCYDGSDYYYFNSSHDAFKTTWSNPLNVFVTELDGNYATIELLFSDGSAEKINWGSDNTLLSDWEGSFDLTNSGYIIVSDISEDEKNELIYKDDDTLYIYSMDNTPFSFMNWTYQDSLNPSSDNTTIDPDQAEADATGIPLPFIKLQKYIKDIIGLVLILAMVIMTAMAGVKNPIVLMFVAIIASVIANIIGLISTSVLVIILVSCVALVLLAITLFKSNDGGN